MKKLFTYRERNNGFTLIEIIIVLAIIGILSGAGIAASLQFNRSQLLKNVAHDFANTLEVAKSRAASQVKPPECIGTLQAYRVYVTTSATQYKLRAMCSTTPLEYPYKKLPAGVTMTRPIDTVIFPILSSSVGLDGNTSVIFTFTSDGASRSVTVFDDGRIVEE